ncbi:uncharacterized protein PG986_012961 [Apiospora aurea]|uniref:Clr5 domain-containing protein n=1 Tax=Apiospora aurea TaxID=335848 RepID=A0ABR1Q1G8_9PEZI
MEAKKRNEKDLKWESFRVDIGRKFVREHLSLENIRRGLQEQGFPVTKNQLNYRLNKIWGLRSKAPRGQAHEFWQSVRQLQASSQPDRSGLGTLVLGNRQRLSTKQWQRQIKRNHIETHSSYYAGSYASVATTQPRLQVALRSPTPERVELPITWPQDLPWLISSFQNLKIETTHHAGSPALRATLDFSLLKVLGIPEHDIDTEWSRARYMSTIASQVPELENGDIEQRPRSMTDAYVGNPDRFQLLIDLIEGSGLTKSPLDLRHRDLTLHSVSDALFQGLFEFLFQISFHRNKLRYDTHRAHRVLVWLLESGQDPNTPIAVGRSSIRTSGLQISLAIGMSDLALELLACGASPDGVKTSQFYPTRPVYRCALNPLYLAILKPGPVLTRLENCGVSLLDDIDIYPFSIPSYGVPYGARIALSLEPLPYIFSQFEDPATTSVVRYLFDRLDQNGRPLYRGLVDWNTVFLYASGAGDLGVLEFLVRRYDDFRRSEYPNIGDLVNMANADGLTALHGAVIAKRNSTETCQFLIRYGAILDRYSDLLHLACYFHALETVEFLHLRGLSINQLCKTRSRTWHSYHSLLRGLDPSRQTPLELILHVLLSKQPWIHYHDKGQYLAVCRYLIDNGAQVPWTMVDVAVKNTNTKLLSLALRSATNILDAYQQASKESSLSTALKLIGSNKDGENTRSVSHLLLDGGAQVGDGDAARAAFLGDWDLVTRILGADTQGSSRTIVLRKRTNYGHVGSPDPWIEITLLEAAILSGSLDVARKAFELSPHQYDASTLCAATLTASILGDDTIVRALLRNRHGQQVSVEQTNIEMTAIGIAAHAGDWELLQLLRCQLTWSDQAIIPNMAELASAFELHQPDIISFNQANVVLHRPGFIRFWNAGPVGSPQVFAAGAIPRIFDLFFDSATLISPMALHAMVDHRLHNHISKVSRKGYRIQQVSSYKDMKSPLHTAICQEDTTLVRACLDLGSDINGFETDQMLHFGIRNQRLSPLALSIQRKDSDIANLLLDKGADVNSPACRTEGMTPLQAVCITGQTGIVMKLLRLGADPNAPGAVVDGSTALEGAAEHGRLDIVHLLLSVGVVTIGPGRRQYIRATRFAHDECHIQIQKLLERHREWTDEDMALWNDPPLKCYDIPLDNYMSGDDSFEEDEEGEGDGEEEEEAKLWSNQQDPSLDAMERDANLDGAPGTGQRGDVPEVYDDPGYQQTTVGNTSGSLMITNDPFIGYGGDDDMLDTRDMPIWDDLFYI